MAVAAQKDSVIGGNTMGFIYPATRIASVDFSPTLSSANEWSLNEDNVLDNVGIDLNMNMTKDADGSTDLVTIFNADSKETEAYIRVLDSTYMGPTPAPTTTSTVAPVSATGAPATGAAAPATPAAGAATAAPPAAGQR